MKSTKAFIAILSIIFSFLATSCVSTLPLNQQFYNSKKVGVILQVDSIGVAKAGSQGLLDMALTQGSRFKEPLQKVQTQLNFEETLQKEVSQILTSKNKPFHVIAEKIDYSNLSKFEKPDSNKKYSKKDFRDFKTKYNVDELLFIKVKYGLLVSYYGVIETEKQGYANMVTEIIDLSDNSLLQQENIQSVSEINGDWKGGQDYANLKNGINVAIHKSIKELKTKF
jgi:hypothetical protein